MLQIDTALKSKIWEALIQKRQTFSGADSAFAKQWGINPAVYSRLKNGELEVPLKDSIWLNIGRILDVSTQNDKWIIVKTKVFQDIEEEVLFCKQHSKAMMYVSETDIGKTETAKYLAKTLNNCFYLDASQAKSKQLFIKLLAATIGIDYGNYAETKDAIKYYLKLLPQPIILIDEAGDLEHATFLELKEFWNATDGTCGWYMLGAEGLKEKFNRGIRQKKVGYREVFSRFSSRFSSSVPAEPTEKQLFYKQLATDILSANMPNTKGLNELVKTCLIKDEAGNYSGLRRAKSLLLLKKQYEDSKHREYACEGTSNI